MWFWKISAYLFKTGEAREAKDPLLSGESWIPGKKNNKTNQINAALYSAQGGKNAALCADHLEPAIKKLQGLKEQAF